MSFTAKLRSKLPSKTSFGIGNDTSDSSQQKASTGGTYLFKVVFVGDSGVGKTGLLLRFIEGKFPSDAQSTIGVDFKMKNLEAGQNAMKLVVWDTAGQERYRALNKMYYRSANAVILVYDVTNPISFSRLPVWLEDLRQWAQPDVLVWLVANKVDSLSERYISKEAGRDFAREQRLFFIETSAKEDVCVNELFYSMAHELLVKAKTDSARENVRLEDFLKKNRSITDGPLTWCCPV